MTSRKNGRSASRKPDNADTTSHELSLAFPATPTLPRVIGRAVSGSGSALLARRKSLASIDLSSSRSSDGQDDLLSTSKICKKLVVHAKAVQPGSSSLDVDLYIKIALPTQAATQSVRLLDKGLVKLQETQVVAYTDAISPNVSSKALKAASAFGIGLASPFADDANPNSYPRLGIIEKGDGVFANIAASKHPIPREEGYRRTCDYVIILSLRVPLVSSPPNEACRTDIPIPTCLQNALHVSLPQLSNAEVDYVMSTQPALRPFSKSRSSASKLSSSASSSSSHPEEVFHDSDYVNISGTFPSTSLLTLRWADRAKTTGLEADFQATLTLDQIGAADNRCRGHISVGWWQLCYVTVQPVTNVTVELHSGDFRISDVDITSEPGTAIVIDSKELDLFRSSGNGSEAMQGTFSRHHSSSIEELRSVLSRTKSSPSKASSSQSIIDTIPPFANQTAEISIDDIQPTPNEEIGTPRLYSPSLSELEPNVKRLRKFTVALDSKHVAKGGNFVLSFGCILPHERTRIPHISITPAASLSLHAHRTDPSFRFSTHDGSTVTGERATYFADQPLFLEVMSAQREAGYFGPHEEHTPCFEQLSAGTKSTADEQEEQTQLLDQTVRLTELPASSSSSLILAQETEPLIMGMLAVVTPSFATSTIHTALRAGISLSWTSLEVVIPLQGSDKSSVFDAFLGSCRIPCTSLDSGKIGGQNMLSFRLDLAEARKCLSSEAEVDEIVILYTTDDERGDRTDEAHSPLIWSMPSFSCGVSNITIRTHSEVPHASTSTGFASDVAVRGKASRIVKLPMWTANTQGRWPIICFADAPADAPKHIRAAEKGAETTEFLGQMPNLQDLPAALLSSVSPQNSGAFILDMVIAITSDFSSRTMHTSLRAQVPSPIARLGLLIPSEGTVENVGLKAFIGSYGLNIEAKSSIRVGDRNMLSYEIDLLAAQEQAATKPDELLITYTSCMSDEDGKQHAPLLWSMPLFSCGVASITVRTASEVPYSSISAGFLIDVPTRGTTSRLLKSSRWQASTSGTWPTICFTKDRAEPTKSVINAQVSPGPPSSLKTYLWYLLFLLLAMAAAMHIVPEIRLIHHKLDRIGGMLQEQDNSRLETLQWSTSAQAVPTRTFTETVYSHLTETHTISVTATPLASSLAVSASMHEHTTEEQIAPTTSFSPHHTSPAVNSVGEPIMSLDAILRRTMYMLKLQTQHIYEEGRNWLEVLIRRLMDRA